MKGAGRRPSGSLTWSLALRYLRGRRSRIVGGTARAALASIALGVMAMVIAMALMSGYRGDLEQKLIAGNAAIVAYPLAPKGGEKKAEEKVRRLPGVTGVERVAFAQGSLSRRSGESVEVTLRGTGGRDRRFGDAGKLLSRPALAGHGVVLGRELAQRLGVRPGDSLRLMALGLSGGRPEFRYRTLVVAGTFTSGFSEFDRSWAVLPRKLIEGLSGGGLKSDLLEISVASAERTGAIADAVRKALGNDYLVSDWRELNRPLFTALRLQQIGLFLILGLIVVVSTFNVASTLVVLVRERIRDIGVLTALGFSPGRLRRVFLLYGALLGAAGTLIGAGAGALVSWLMTAFRVIRFGPDIAAIYFVDSVTFRVVPRDVAAVAVFALVITLLACWLPSRRAARVSAADALRYE